MYWGKRIDIAEDFPVEWIPDTAHVRGMSFFKQGWNTELKLRTHGGGAITYQLDDYILYWFIPIAPLTICKQGGRWVMLKDAETVICEKLSNLSQETPFGEWTMGVSVYGTHSMK